jgi:hypothetical protein
VSFAVGKVALRIFPSTLYPRSIILPVQTPYLNCNITLIRTTFGQNLSTFRDCTLSDNGEQRTENLFNFSHCINVRRSEKCCGCVQCVF